MVLDELVPDAPEVSDEELLLDVPDAPDVPALPLEPVLPVAPGLVAAVPAVPAEPAPEPVVLLVLSVAAGPGDVALDDAVGEPPDGEVEPEGLAAPELAVLPLPDELEPGVAVLLAALRSLLPALPV
jgi:hypothetical protein